MAGRYQSWSLIEHSFHQAEHRRPGLAGETGNHHPNLQGQPAAPLGVNLFLQSGPRFRRKQSPPTAWVSPGCGASESPETTRSC
ncbi:MAG: hypothetical protein AB9907_06095 [Flexilinea sp.]